MLWPVTPDQEVTPAFQSYSLKLCVLLSALFPKKSTLDEGLWTGSPVAG